MTFYQRELQRLSKTVYANSHQVQRVIAIRRYIDMNYARELKLGLLSNIGLTSKFHLLRLFKKYYGQTPKQYLIERRLGEAKKYLKKGMTVTDTCFSVGFESAASFSTLFKSRTGLSPMSFQKRQFSRVH